MIRTCLWCGAKEQFFYESSVIDFSTILRIIMTIYCIEILHNLNKYMSIYNNTTFCYCFEEVKSWQESVIVKIKKFKCFEKYSIVTNFWGCLELNFILEFALKTRVIINDTLQSLALSYSNEKLSDIFIIIYNQSPSQN